MATEQALLAAGCFWGVQKRFSTLAGVIRTCVGYTGGHIDEPTYPIVCRGDSGHAEAIRIEFDTSVIDYRSLLHFFFDNHNPTTLNAQGPDHGSQYRSAIFYFNATQQQIALEVIRQLNQKSCFASPIVTEVTAAGPFFEAEQYHQDYWLKNR